MPSLEMEPHKTYQQQVTQLSNYLVKNVIKDLKKPKTVMAKLHHVTENVKFGINLKDSA